MIVAQRMEAGGHRGCFEASQAERRLVGSFALIPAVADAVEVPVVATGGIGDARGVAAALVLGASAVQIGSAFLRCPEASHHPAWAEALAFVAPEDTIVTSVFSGRAGRSVATTYALAAIADEAPPPAPYPVQRGLTSAMRARAAETGDLQRMQASAGQSARLGRTEPPADWYDAHGTELWRCSNRATPRDRGRGGRTPDIEPENFRSGSRVARTLVSVVTGCQRCRKVVDDRQHAGGHVEKAAWMGTGRCDRSPWSQRPVPIHAAFST